jgi:signal transduction histidine kinase
VLAIGLHVGFDDEVAGALFTLPDWAVLLVLVAMAAALTWRRARPETVMGVTGGLTAVYYFVGESTPAAMLLLTFALYAVTAFAEKRSEGVLSLVACWFFMTVSFVVGGGLDAVLSPSFVLSGFVFTVAWTLGVQTRSRLRLTDELRRRNAQLAELRERERDELVGEERRRIARELHDVVSHTVSVVVVQASAARRIGERDPGAVQSALTAIERAAREAMGELRTMLGLLRDDDVGGPEQPTPGRAEFARLVDELRAAGLPLRIEGELPDDLTAGVSLTVHRIVQEALTNVLRHARDVTEVVVAVDHDGDALRLRVTDDGRPAGFTEGAGAGLVGIRERAALHGGTVRAGPRPGGRGYEVEVTLPAKVSA